MIKVFILGLLLVFAGGVSQAAEATALSLVKEGNRYVGEQAKDKVVEIRSERTVGGLEPTIWYVVYFDPTATFKAVEVKFGAGKMMDVKRPLRVIEAVGKGSKEMDATKLKVDSDKAIETAVKDPLLEKITVKSLEARLRNGAGGPVWLIKLWAAKPDKPGEQVDIGEITLFAEDGHVLKRDLHLQRLH